jgi:hypothetical protein
MERQEHFVKNTLSELEQLVHDFGAVAARQTEDEGDAADPATSMRERFFELLVLALANLYGKTPVASTLYDRTTLRRVTDGMDDNDAGKLSLRTEDWVRLEGLVRGQEGQKAYCLGRPALAVLSVATSGGTLGEVFEKILAQYATQNPTEELRRITRLFGAYFIARLP